MSGHLNKSCDNQSFSCYSREKQDIRVDKESQGKR